MSVQLKQNADASMGLQGTDLDDGAFIMRDLQYDSADSGAVSIFVAPRRMVLKGVNCRPDVAGTDAGAVTASFYRAASGVAIGSGVLLHTGSANLKGTINTNQTLTLAATATLDIPAGTAIGVVFAGVMTAAKGTFTLAFAPA